MQPTNTHTHADARKSSISQCSPSSLSDTTTGCETIGHYQDLYPATWRCAPRRCLGKGEATIPNGTCKYDLVVHYTSPVLHTIKHTLTCIYVVSFLASIALSIRSSVFCVVGLLHDCIYIYIYIFFFDCACREGPNGFSHRIKNRLKSKCNYAKKKNKLLSLEAAAKELKARDQNIVGPAEKTHATCIRDMDPDLLALIRATG